MLHLFVVAQVLGVYQVAVLYPFAELFTEGVERSVCPVSGGLDFDRANLFPARKDEVNFVIVFFVLCPGVVKKLIALGCQHLSHKILVNVAQVCGQFIRKHSFVDDIFGKVFVPKCKCHEQPRVADK